MTNSGDLSTNGREHQTFFTGWRRGSRYLEKPLLIALAITFVDILSVFLIMKRIPGDTLALILFLQGGIGLITGVGVSLSSTPTISRVSEEFLGTSPWSHDAERHAERVGWKWMIASTLLILIGFIASAI